MMIEQFSVMDKVVVVTGSSRGLGRAIADGFHELKAQVIYVSRSAPEGIEFLEKDPSRCFISCDLSDLKQVKELSSEIIQRAGKVDCLINAAGITHPAVGSPETPYLDHLWDQTQTVNVKSIYYLSVAIATEMKKKGKGSIVNVTSIASELGFGGNPAYVASKGGLKQLTKAMANDWSAFGVRFNNLTPGYFKTQMTEGSYSDPQKREARSSRTLLGRWGDPKELVGPAVFLASDASSYITGVDIIVDGGWSAKGL